MRTFAIGDIHGGFKALEQLIKQLKLITTDKLIFLGDYVDGWSESAQTIQYLLELSKHKECVFIKGNHDLWCEDWLRTNKGDDTWLFHGGKHTVASYASFSDKEKEKHLNFFERMPLCYVDTEKRLFVHAGFTSMHGAEKEVNKNTLCFDRTLWEMVTTMDKRIKKHSHLYPNRLKHYKEIYIGHTPTQRYNSDVPMNAINVWNVDTGAAFTGKLSAINIETKEVFQTEVVCSYYANERGRNSKSYNEEQEV